MRFFPFFLVFFPFLVYSEDSDSEFFEINIDRDHPEKVYKAFEEFKKKFNRKYKDGSEAQKRFNNFVKTYNNVDKLNQKTEEKGLNTKFAINKFSDLSQAEFRSRLSHIRPNITKVPRHSLKKSGNLTNLLRRKRQTSEQSPLNFDLRYQKVNGRYIIGKVKDQGACSCCWGFAVTAMVESVYAVNIGRFRALSDQELCDCGTDGTPGCTGGGLFGGVEYVINNGLASEFDYHFYDESRAKVSGQCDARSAKRLFPPRQLDYHECEPETAIDEIQQILFQWKTPVAVYFAVGPPFRNYAYGVLVAEDCDKSGLSWHAGVIVGYGEERDRFGRMQKYWTVKNSWGDSEWGDRGYIKIIRGRNWCNIESGAIGANVVDHYHA